jgi:hypothetical protein
MVLIAQQHGKGFITNVLLRAQHGVAQSVRVSLPDVVDIAQLAGGLDGCEFLGVPLALKGGFEGRHPVKVVFQSPFVAPGDHEEVVEADIHGFLNHVLDGRLVHDGEHFLGHRLGCRQEPGTESGGRDDGFANSRVTGSHRTNLTSASSIQ